MELLDVTTKWKFNIPVLKENVGGIGGGNVTDTTMNITDIDLQNDDNDQIYH